VFELGLRAHAERRYAEAEQLYQRVLDIRTRSLGAADPAVAEVLTRMGLLNESLSKAADAESFYQRAIAIFETAGRETPEYALAMELYAHRLRDQNRIPDATQFEERARLIRSAHVGRRETAQTSNALRVGDGVTAPRVASKIEPEYSEEARIAKYQGTVVLYIEVGTDGLAHNIQLKRSLGLGLDEKAAEAIGRWRFQPGTKDGLPVTVQATVEINFRLK
jgi:TonB family protein